MKNKRSIDQLQHEIILNMEKDSATTIGTHEQILQLIGESVALYSLLEILIERHDQDQRHAIIQAVTKAKADHKKQFENLTGNRAKLVKDSTLATFDILLKQFPK